MQDNNYVTLLAMKQNRIMAKIKAMDLTEDDIFFLLANMMRGTYKNNALVFQFREQYYNMYHEYEQESTVFTLDGHNEPLVEYVDDKNSVVLTYDKGELI